MGIHGPDAAYQDVYLRTAVNVGREGWAHFGHVPMKDYGGISWLSGTRTGIGFGEHKGDPTWQQVPGE